MNYLLSRLGARLGNWNDRVNGGHDSARLASRRWRLIDRLSSLLYVRGDR